MTNPIIISDIQIHQDPEGRYSLNDLHKASGGDDRHKPAFWLRIDQTKEVIKEVIKLQICNFQPINVMRGCKGGTYVCRELVYSYAMWVSASFHVAVIRAYDALVTTQLVTPAKTTTDERTPLRDAINMLVGKKGIMYPEAYSFVHQRFNVVSIEDLAPETLPAAIEYVHHLALEGELLERERTSIFPLDVDLYLQIRDGKTIFTRTANPGECFMSVDTSMEMAKRAGYVVIHCDELERLAVPELAKRADTARRAMQKWSKIAAQ